MNQATMRCTAIAAKVSRGRAPAILKEKYIYRTTRNKTYTGSDYRNLTNDEYSNPNAGKNECLEPTLVTSTLRWFETIVIGPQKLCPFAPPLVSSSTKSMSNTGLLRIVSSDATSAQEAIKDIEYEAELLLNRKRETQPNHMNDTKNHNEEEAIKISHETTLVVFDESLLSEVRNFRSFVQLSWEMQQNAVVDKGYGSELQLVLFHPKAAHDTYAISEDAANFTIRSPFPTVHLLREEDIMRAVKSGYPDLENLPTRNKAKMRKLGIQTCQSRLNQCYE